MELDSFLATAVVNFQEPGIAILGVFFNANGDFWLSGGVVVSIVNFDYVSES